MDRGVFVSRKEAENTTLSEALDRYEREVIPDKKGAVQERSRVRIWKRSALASRPLGLVSMGRTSPPTVTSGSRKRHPQIPSAWIWPFSLIFSRSQSRNGEWEVSLIRSSLPAFRKTARKGQKAQTRRTDRVCAASESPILPTLARLAVETGMRQAEFAEIIWDRVDLKKRTVTLFGGQERGEVDKSPSLRRPAGF